MSTFISEPKVKIHKLKKGDPGFKITHNLLACDRAAIDIDARCPANIRYTIICAYNEGYVNPIAYVTEQELTFMGLTR